MNLSHVTSAEWLVYSKTILQKVSFDIQLFAKEVLKAIRLLEEKEIGQLKSWVVDNFNMNLSVTAIALIEDKRWNEVRSLRASVKIGDKTVS